MNTELNPTNSTEPQLLAEDIALQAPEVPKQLTRKQMGALRRQYVTVVYGTVLACGHKAKFSAANMREAKQPNNNCVHCWEAYFMTCVDFEGIHVILTQKGAKELVRVRGTKFAKMFHGFLSSKLLPALAAETAKEEAAVQIEGGTFGVQETNS